ncbi:MULTISPECIES: ABC transporter permease [Actinoalloteichus]|uniref:ABC-type nitrate/sulfonate/bicarbonate transport system, permease component n=1 Tax=Actinoalloteichus fjordicus TaxID=1612552 RepID=A0AAC9LC22_9PSEU|nr:MULTISPECIES: ABC transporter permease [Actinoalloteichus]APU14832.1 ABC-type nitrate/sulfonate/bicarbonate transport system, permease component [Actinoalloteichus fjordicus]APU20801.1 ABC-type nitrate/sulfonate/bicarbonate transport system, permease component [Actinoalloteichus sp. GBA129-24]
MTARSTIDDADGAASPTVSGVADRGRPGATERLAGFLDQAWRPVALLAVLFAGWWAVTAAELVEPYLVPSPGDTLRAITERPEYFLDNTLVTTYETVLGFVIAAAVGVLAAVVMVYSSTIEKTLYPLLLFAQVIPKIAIAPLFVVWLGFGLEPKVVVAVLMAFFPVVISMVTGLKSIDPEMLELSATMGASPAQTFWKIRFPASLPHLFAGLKIAATMAVTGAVVGEFVGANEGLGFVILQANGNLDTPVLFAGLIVMSLLGVALFVLVEVAEYFLLPWHASRRSNASATTF